VIPALAVYCKSRVVRLTRGYAAPARSWHQEPDAAKEMQEGTDDCCAFGSFVGTTSCMHTCTRQRLKSAKLGHTSYSDSGHYIQVASLSPDQRPA
jgi:hypothetical protein